MTTNQEKIDYLLGFYTREQITKFCLGGDLDEQIDILFNHTQPVEVNIEDLASVNQGAKFLADSPDGWVPIEQWRNKGTKSTFEFVLASGKSVTASHDHLFQRPNGVWSYASEFNVGDSMLTQMGGSTVIMKRPAGEQVVYDLAIDHENHRYYTDDISSHNSGKSLFLQNLALNWSFMGLDVVYFSLELAEPLVSSRLDCMVSNMGTRDLFKKVSDASMAIKMVQRTRKAGRITVKKMPEAGTTTNVLRSYLKEYEIQMGKKPDAVIVDYLDIMYPNNAKIDPTNAFAKDKYVSEELRAMYSELDLLGASASQLNRGSVEANGVFDHSHIAGGISKINTADNVFAIYTNAAMKERGEYQLHMLKTRSSSAVGQNLTLAYNNVTMLISDYEEGPDVVPLSQAQLQKNLKDSLAPKKKPSLGTVTTTPKPQADTEYVADTDDTPPWDDVPPPKQQPAAPAAPSDARAKMLLMMKRVQDR